MVFSVLAASLVGCSKEDSLGREEIQESGKESPISLSLEVEGDESDLVYSAKDRESGRALTIEPDPANPGKYRLSQNSTWTAHLMLKNKLTGHVGYVSYEFDYVDRNPVNNKIHLKYRTKSATIKMLGNAGSWTAPTDASVRAGQWYVAAIVGGGKLLNNTIQFGRHTTFTDSPYVYDPSTTGTDVEQVEAPLVGQWKQLELRGGSYTTADPLELKPQGVILKINAKNNTGQNITHPYVAGAIVSSNAGLLMYESSDISKGVYTEVSFDFGVGTSGLSSVGYRRAGSWTSAQLVLRHAPANAGATSSQYVWVGLDSQKTTHSFEVWSTGYHVYSAKGYPAAKEEYVYDSSLPGTKKLSDGKRAEVSLVIEKAPRMPIEYVSDYNLAGGYLPLYNVPNGNSVMYNLGANHVGNAGPLRAERADEAHGRLDYGYYSGYFAQGVSDPKYNPSGAVNLSEEVASLGAYRLPSIEDWYGVVPKGVFTELGKSNETINDTFGTYATSYSATGKQFLFRTASSGRRLWTDPVADPNNPEATVVYGFYLTKPVSGQGMHQIKFEGTDSYGGIRPNTNYKLLLDNGLTMAYRIRTVGNYSANTPETDVDNHVVIEATYLGEEVEGLSLADISNESWWQGRQIVKRVFNMSGAVHTTTFGFRLYQPAIVVKYWAVSPPGGIIPTGQYKNNWTSEINPINAFGNRGSANYDYFLQIRLFNKFF